VGPVGPTSPTPRVRAAQQRHNYDLACAWRRGLSIKHDNNQRALARGLAKERQAMIYVVLSAGVFTFSALLIHRESRMLARIEARRRARGLGVP
jgi:hypothetical protein